MPARTVGLYIGKFQPFHKGHLYAVRYITTRVDRLIIAIGSSQYHDLVGQPFSAQERRQMLKRTLVAERIANVSIFEVTDIHDDKRWVEHVTNTLPKFDVVFSNNELVRRLFNSQGFSVESTKFLIGVNGTFIRQKLTGREADWQAFVPAQSAEVIRASTHYVLGDGPDIEGNIQSGT